METNKNSQIVSHQRLVKDKKALSMRKSYMIHKYYVNNDKHHWPKIHAKLPEYGEITHSDYSKLAPQKGNPAMLLQLEAIIITGYDGTC